MNYSTKKTNIRHEQGAKGTRIIIFYWLWYCKDTEQTFSFIREKL